MAGDLYAVVAAAGGAGATRLSLEFAGALACDGRDVAVVDAAFATQGLATAVPGDVDPDVTGVLVDDGSLGAATTDLGLDVPGRVAVAPARAPFERLARAKTSECARRLAERLSDAADAYDAVLVDVPPVAANQAVAAVTAADRVALVAPDTQRGADALAPARDRLTDVDAPVDVVVANRTDGEADLSDADVAVPECEVTALSSAPVCPDRPEFHVAVGQAVETVCETTVDLPDPESDSLTDYLPR